MLFDGDRVILYHGVVDLRSIAEDWPSLTCYSIKSDLQKEDFLHADETPLTL